MSAFGSSQPNGLKVNSRAGAGGFSGAPAPQKGGVLGAPGIQDAKKPEDGDEEEEPVADDSNDMTKTRTFDMFWVERKALMYQSGSKVRIAGFDCCF